MREEKGITLIALVITIIVMLILVSVTITIAVQGKLFNNAGEAVKETQKEVDRENNLASGIITDKGNTINEVVNSALGRE